MFRNYLKFFLHNLTGNKLFATINIAGLGLGLACFVLIAMYVQHELAYEQQFAKADRIYRVARDFFATERSIETHLATMAGPAAPLLKQDFAQIEQVTRISLPQEIVIGAGRDGCEGSEHETGAGLAL